MLDFPLMLRVKLPVVDIIQVQSNKFSVGVENEATGDSKLNDSPGDVDGLSINSIDRHSTADHVRYNLHMI